MRTGLEFDAAEAVWLTLNAYRAGSADVSDSLIGRLSRNVGCSGTATFDKGAAKLEDFILV